jgi:hypothetical protein
MATDIAYRDMRSLLMGRCSYYISCEIY